MTLPSKIPPREEAREERELGRRERRRLELHARILAAAIELFDERGFGTTRVQAICERADIAHKTFFNHFPSKQDLLREIAHSALERFLGEIEDVRRQPIATSARIQLLFERIADNADAAGPMRPELLHELIQVAHATDTDHETARRLHEAFGAIVRDGITAGDIASRHEAATLTELLMGAFYALMFNWTNFAGYPLRRQALSAARFLGEAMTAPSDEETP